MSKLAVLLVVVAMVACVTAVPVPNGYNPFGLFDIGNFFPAALNPLNPDSIINMKPSGPNATAVGSFVSISQSIKTVDGKQVKEDTNRIITNIDGKVSDKTYNN